MKQYKTEKIISDEARYILHEFYSGYSIETTPRLDGKIDSYKSILPSATTVMIASPNNASIKEIIQTAKRLNDDGMVPVPHIVARSIPNLEHLESLLDQLQEEANVDHVLVIAGDTNTPAGPYRCTMDVLDLGVFEKHRIKKIAVSGHPEGSPYVKEKELWEALRLKNEYASSSECDVYICTQFVFEASPIISWEQKIRDQGNQLPIKVGVCGIATLQTLLRLAAASGIGQSMRFLTQQAPHIKQVLAHHTPQKLIKDLAVHCVSDPSNLIEGIHFFPFGGVEKTSQWIAKQL